MARARSITTVNAVSGRMQAIIGVARGDAALATPPQRTTTRTTGLAAGRAKLSASAAS
jgi:hypothetical protein